jgi:hypothetical protein
VPFAIRYSLFAIRRSYRSPLAARRSLFLLFAIRHSPILPLATRCSPLAKEASAPVLFSPPHPIPTPMPLPPGPLPNFSPPVQQIVLDNPNPNSYTCSE